jgi:hypothetical protein
MPEICEESYRFLEGLDIVSLPAGYHRFTVYISIHFGDEYILGSNIRGNEEAAGEIGADLRQFDFFDIYVMYFFGREWWLWPVVIFDGDGGVSFGGS